MRNQQQVTKFQSKPSHEMSGAMKGSTGLPLEAFAAWLVMVGSSFCWKLHSLPPKPPREVTVMSPQCLETPLGHPTSRGSPDLISAAYDFFCAYDRGKDTPMDFEVHTPQAARVVGFLRHWAPAGPVGWSFCVMESCVSMCPKLVVAWSFAVVV